MNTLKDFVNWKLIHSDKVAEAEGYPLIMENCKKNKKMKQLKIYGNSVQVGTPAPENPIEVQGVGDLVTDEADVNYGKYKIPVVIKSINLFNISKYPLTNNTIIWGHSGLTGNTDGFACTVDFIPCVNLQGETITINHTKGSNPGIAFYDESKTYISGVRYVNETSKTVTVPENAIYYRFTVDADYINEIQVQYGDTVTPYEPYIEPITTNVFLNEPLRKIGDYADYIDGKGGKVVRRVKAQSILSTATISKNSYFLNYCIYNRCFFYVSHSTKKAIKRFEYSY